MVRESQVRRELALRRSFTCPRRAENWFRLFPEITFGEKVMSVMITG
jgi:hypothetical protein